MFLTPEHGPPGPNTDPQAGVPHTLYNREPGPTPGPLAGRVHTPVICSSEPGERQEQSLSSSSLWPSGDDPPPRNGEDSSRNKRYDLQLMKSKRCRNKKHQSQNPKKASDRPTNERKDEEIPDTGASSAARPPVYPASPGTRPAISGAGSAHRPQTSSPNRVKSSCQIQVRGRAAPLCWDLALARRLSLAAGRSLAPRSGFPQQNTPRRVLTGGNQRETLLLKTTQGGGVQLIRGSSGASTQHTHTRARTRTHARAHAHTRWGHAFCK